MAVVDLESVEEGLRAVLQRYQEQFPDTRLASVIEYSLFPGGKRVRPALFLGLAADFGLLLSDVLPTASAIELIHSSTLIHDDLPSLDDDDERRGKPACHIQHGDAEALLAGNTMIMWALAEVLHSSIDSESVRIEASSLLAKTYIAVCEGQVLDLAGPETREDLDLVHQKKTAILFETSALLAAVCAQADNALKNRTREYGFHYGMAFQLLDDIDDANAGELEPSNIVRVATSAQVVEYVNVSLRKLSAAHTALKSLLVESSNLDRHFLEMKERLLSAAESPDA